MHCPIGCGAAPAGTVVAVSAATARPRAAATRARRAFIDGPQLPYGACALPQ
ncbi:hypothetical protein [Streptomyces noboritoensis]|uniref:hypothetical protein n=1 Tax=Streptomyces noboritoensis TaxID=67337 RepID=UPI00373FD529